MEGLVGSETFQGVKFAAGCSWSPLTRVATILFWVWSDAPTLIDRFRHARKITMTAFSPEKEVGRAYQPFMRIVVRWTPKLLARLMARFQHLMWTQLSEHFRRYGYALFAVDGSRFEVPRTSSNLQAFAAKENNGKRKRHKKSERTTGDIKKGLTTQIWTTVMWHVGLGLPWDWRRGQTGSSEREHFRDMIPGLPRTSLVAADAGFAGYEYWSALMNAGHHFVIRVGANIRLLTQLGALREVDQNVYLWTEKSAQQNAPPLRLRLVVLQRQRPIYLVTSVLEASHLSDDQRAEIYRLRWGVELFYRSVKQTFERRKLRSNTAAHALCELDWSLLGLWAVMLFARLHNRDVEPRQQSVAKTLRAVRQPMREYQSLPEAREDPWTLVSLAINPETTRRRKSNPDYPRKKKHDPIGAPNIQRATPEQRQKARPLLLGKPKLASKRG